MNAYNIIWYFSCIHARVCKKRTTNLKVVKITKGKGNDALGLDLSDWQGDLPGGLLEPTLRNCVIFSRVQFLFLWGQNDCLIHSFSPFYFVFSSTILLFIVILTWAFIIPIILTASINKDCYDFKKLALPTNPGKLRFEETTIHKFFFLYVL